MTLGALLPLSGMLMYHRERKRERFEYLCCGNLLRQNERQSNRTTGKDKRSKLENWWEKKLPIQLKVMVWCPWTFSCFFSLRILTFLSPTDWTSVSLMKSQCTVYSEHVAWNEETGLHVFPSCPISRGIAPDPHTNARLSWSAYVRI